MATKNLTLFSKRAYTVAAENARVLPVASTIRKVVAPAEWAKETKEEVFWMRDPKTGNYIPENRFDEVDVADLRKKLLFNKST